MPEITARVAAVVVTWNSARDIRRCLNSLFSQTKPPDAIIVVDNHSSDSTCQIVRTEFPTVKLVCNAHNLGFAAANNQAIEQAAAEWYLTLNPDAYLAPNWLELTLDFAASRPAVGSVGGILFAADADGSPRDEIDSLGIEIFLSRRVRDAGHRRSGLPLPAEPVQVFGVCSAAALYRGEMLKDVRVQGEVFPSSFISYYEDADLAWRAWRRRWEAYLVPDAHGWHKRGGSNDSGNYARKMVHRNRWLLVARNERLSNLFHSLGPVLLHEIFMLARLIRHPTLLAQVWQTLRLMPAAARSRRELSDSNPVPPPFKRGVGFEISKKNFKRDHRH